VLVAFACGVLGAGFTLLLKAVERLAFGFSTGTLAEAVTRVDAAMLGAAAFLAGAIRAPITAAVFAIEFTGAMYLFAPVALAVAGACGATAYFNRARYSRP
jgi:chloride channel protein, CIC family